MTNIKALDEAVRRMTHRKDRKVWERCIDHHFKVPNEVALGLREKFIAEYRRIIAEDGKHERS